VDTYGGWAERLGISRRTIQHRVQMAKKRGLPPQAAVSPSNTWAAGKNGKTITIGNQTLTISQWCQRIGTPVRAAYYRIQAGWDPGLAVMTPGRQAGKTRAQARWEGACLLYRGRVLTGEEGHFCFAWDGLPIDETCDEWPCECVRPLLKEGRR
jgi:hypothetical protein